MSTAKNPAAEHRRKRLRAWIDTHFAGLQTAFIASTNDGEKQINQGELSGLLATKSFGEKRARSLEKQAHMPAHYLDQPDADPFTHTAADPNGPQADTGTPTGWPFTRVSLERVMLLKRGLGGHKGVEAMHDLDETLELAVQKWERRLDRQKNRAA